MFRLLALVATTLAAPQYYYPGYMGYPGYPMSIYGQPAISYNPIYSPRRFMQPSYLPVVQAAPVVPGDNTRAFFGAGALQEVNGNFAAHDPTAAAPTTTASQVIVGTLSLTQNALTNLLYNNDAQYKIYVRTTGANLDLTGQNVIVAIGDDCLVAAPTGQTPDRRLATVNVPAHFNGFYLSGATTGFNLDGMNGKTDLTANPTRIQILNAAGTQILGCNDVDLA